MTTGETIDEIMSEPEEAEHDRKWHFVVNFDDDTNFRSNIPLDAFDGEFQDKQGEDIIYSYYVDDAYADRFAQTLEDDGNVFSYTQAFVGTN